MRLANPSDLPGKTEVEQKAFFDDVRNVAAAAEGALGTFEHDLALAGTVIRLVFAGAALRRRTLPALAHLCIPLQPRPDVTFHIWESEESELALPPCPCPSLCFTDRGEIWTMLSKRVRSAFHWSEYSLSLLNLETCEGIYWVRSAEDLPFWTIASPFRTLFHWWILENGGHLLHAAAVGTEQGGLLITGKGGVGKSTTALASLESGFRYIADDYVAVTLDPEPTAHSLYSTAKVDADQAGRFAQFNPRFLPGGAGVDPKAVMFLHPSRRDALAASLPLRAILTPSFGSGSDTMFEPAPAHVVKDAAGFTTMCQLPHAGQATLDFIENLVGALPRFNLRLGRQVERVPAALAALLDDVAGLPRTSALPDRTDAAGQPPVSVVIPVHNGAHFLADAVGSILDQKYPAIEIIVVDDGSSDDIEEAVAALPVEINFVRQEAGGPGVARNRGIREAKADFIAFLDVDDLWPADMLAASFHAFSADTSLDLVTGHAQLVQYDPGQNQWDFVENPERSYPHYIGAALYRRRLFERVGLFDERLRFAEDSDWFLRAEQAGAKMKRLDRVSLLVRRHGSNMTAGKTDVETTPLRLFKNMLDLRRAAKAEADGASKEENGRNWPNTAVGP